MWDMRASRLALQFDGSNDLQGAAAASSSLHAMAHM
jgi:hypothetical protein